jgi:parallel beta-helix repeat protein
MAGVTITESGASTDVTEGGVTDDYTVVLDTQPSADVTISITPSGQITVNPVMLTFTTATWSVAQTVTVTAVDDFIVEGAHNSTITHTASSADSNYGPALVVSDVTANITDNDTACISSGDQQDINEALNQPGSVAVLCQGAVFDLSGSVVFTGNGQKIYTEGFPTDDRRAVLRVADPSVISAVVMIDRSNVELRNVVVDGNRPSFGHVTGDALILAGGSASGQVIREIKAFEPRSWSILHLFEGPPPRCSGALVEDNELGPAGQQDGTWADGISMACTNSIMDGISMACTNSIIRNNTITDATDGGIVIFGAPGSVIEDNVIRASTRVLLGGINMVDFFPYAGDYTNTRVRRNVIDAAGAVIRIGLGMGNRVWICLDPVNPNPPDPTLFGAVVTENILRGNYMQYGFAVDGVRDWTVTGNVDLANHSGTPTTDCNGQVASPPAGFQFYSARAEGVFQTEFTESFLELALWAIDEPRP